MDLIDGVLPRDSDLVQNNTVFTRRSITGSGLVRIISIRSPRITGKPSRVCFTP